jgi:hypothetical protein
VRLCRSESFISIIGHQTVKVVFECRALNYDIQLQTNLNHILHPVYSFWL